MAITFNLEGLKGNSDVNKLTAILIELDGVENVEVAQHWAEIEGRIDRQKVKQAIERAGYKVKS